MRGAPNATPHGPSAEMSEAMMRLVDVPISVHMPPSIEAKESGMSSFDLSWPILSDHVSMIGISIATMGVLFMNACDSVGRRA